MTLNVQKLVLAVVVLTGAGCASVTPCIQMPADGKPVVIDFGKDITMRIDRVLGRSDPARPFVVHGVVRNHSHRYWRNVTLRAKLDFQPDDSNAAPDAAASRSGQAAVKGAIPMDLRASVKFLGPGDTAMEVEAGCVGQPRDCIFKGLRMGNWQMEMKYEPQPTLKDGICRTLVGAWKPRRTSGHFALRPHLALLGPEPAEAGLRTEVLAGGAPEMPAKDESARVEAPKNEAPRVEPSKTPAADEAWAEIYDGHYEDEHVELNLNFRADELHLSIQNRSAQAIRVDWDDLVWVGPEGDAMPLVRSSLQAGAPFAAPSPALIPARARIQVALMRDDGRLPTPKRPRHSHPRDPFMAHGPPGEGQVGQILGIYLPLMVGETPHPLDLRFRIEALIPDHGWPRRPQRQRARRSGRRGNEKAPALPEQSGRGAGDTGAQGSVSPLP